jgi:hypothetical protein
VTREEQVHLLRTQKVMSSPSGRIAGVLSVPGKPGRWRIRHAAYDVAEEFTEARILRVSVSRVVFWASDGKGRAGTWSATQGRLAFRHPLLEMLGVRPTSLGLIPCGRNANDNDRVTRYVLPQGPVVVSKHTQNVFLHDGSMASFDLDTQECSRWIRSPGGVMVPRPVQLPKTSFESLKMVHWQGSMIGFVLQGKNGNSLWVGGRRLDLGGGELEEVSCSPSDSAFVMKLRTHPGDPNDPRLGPSRSLVLVEDGKPRTFMSGHFDVGREDLRWSVSGRHVGASVVALRLDRHGQLIKERMLVTSEGDKISYATEELDDAASHVTEFQLGPNGMIASFAVDDGYCSRVIIPDADEVVVPLAWNLQAREGHVTYNVLQDDERTLTKYATRTR